MLGEPRSHFVLSTDEQDLTDVCYTARHQCNQGYQWLKINVDARRAITIVYLNLRSN